MIAISMPNGDPSHCIVCQAPNDFQLSEAADMPCLGCGYLLWKTYRSFLRVQAMLADRSGIAKELITMKTDLRALAEDSLSAVAAFMYLEEEMELDITEIQAECLKTVGDVVLLLASRA